MWAVSLHFQILLLITFSDETDIHGRFTVHFGDKAAYKTTVCIQRNHDRMSNPLNGHKYPPTA
jgi:hypothetical protein